MLYVTSSHWFCVHRCRDRSNRQVPDRRGDSATATNSNAAGAAPEGLGASADPEHTAQAAVLLEEFKAKSKSQNFELAVSCHNIVCMLRKV